VKRSCFVIVVALGLLGAAGGQAQGQRNANPGSVPGTGSFTLEINFSGLIGFAQDQGKVWAFLVKADEVDENAPDKLPPGIAQENSGGTLKLADELPRHRAWIRFKNAKVTSGSAGDPKKGRPIAGDLSFDTGGQGLGAVDLTVLADASHVRQTLKSVPTTPASSRVAEIDELDPVLVEPALDSRLVARARVEAGTVIARKLDECNRLPRYSFATGLTDQCPGAKNDAVFLGEEVVATQTGLSGPVTVNIDRGGAGRESIVLEPTDRNKALTIEVLNDVDIAIDNPDLSPCLMRILENFHHPHEHPLVFRWYYRLSPPAVQTRTAEHFFPCEKVVSFGPPKCPQKLFVVKPGGKS
jgi:hypothetical protein